MSKYAKWEEPAQEGEPFDFDATPERFYFEVESIGNLEPDAIIQNGIKVLQNKLAAVIQDLTAEGQPNGNTGGGYDATGTEDDGMNGGQNWQSQGYTTPYGNSGDATWNTGGATPYGATPYGQNGQNGWNN
jgi:DNA-directed RNA polymerase II subunit RPB3